MDGMMEVPQIVQHVPIYVPLVQEVQLVTVHRVLEILEMILFLIQDVGNI